MILAAKRINFCCISARPFPKHKRTILGGSRSFRKRKDAPPLRKYVRVLRGICKDGRFSSSPKAFVFNVPTDHFMQV